MRKRKFTGYVHYAALVCLSFGIFYWLNHLSESQTKFLLDFYKNVVEIFFGNTHYFDEMNGYYVGNNYIISESCLGLNVIVLIFAVCSMANTGRLRSVERILWILTSGLIAVITGVFANILRLVSSIYFTVFARFELIHALLGIVIYLSALIFCYAFSIRIFKKKAGGAEFGKQEKHEEHEEHEEHIQSRL